MPEALRSKPFTTYKPLSGHRPSLRVFSVARPQQKTPKTSENAGKPSNKLQSGALTLLGLGAITGGGMLGSGFDVAGPESVLQALGVLAAVVGVHEAGHFLAARVQNIHVNKFSIGFGPSLITYQGGEVEYSLRAFPLGGFVAFPDDDPDCKYPPDDPDLLRNRPVLDRAIVTVAGVIANVIFAYTICVVQAGTVGLAQPEFLPGVKLGNISPGAVAAEAGLQRGDIVLSIGDMKVAPSPNSVNDVVTYIQDRAGKPLVVEVDRQGQIVDIKLTPSEMADGTGRIGVSLGANVKVSRVKAESFGAALSMGADDFNKLAGTVLKGLSQFVSNFKETAERVSGPVAILAVGSEVARTDATGLYQFAALINLNLAIVNILPLPALDGELKKKEKKRGGWLLEGGIGASFVVSFISLFHFFFHLFFVKYKFSALLFPLFLSFFICIILFFYVRAHYIYNSL